MSEQPGRRIAARPRRRRPDRASLAALALVLVAAGAVWALSVRDVERPASVPTPARMPVDQRSVVCPSMPPAGGPVLLGSAPVESLGDGGQIDVGAVGDLGDAVDRAGRSRSGPSRGELVTLRGRQRGPTVVRASGELAAGLFGHRVSAEGEPAAVGACVAPRGTWWFTGAGGSVTHASSLRIVNIDPGTAVVDVVVYGPDGPVETLGTRGISIPPGAERVLELAEIAPETDDLAVGVTTSRGRVAVAVDDTFSESPITPVGRDWLPAQAEPRRVNRLVGLPPRSDSHTVVVANPSDREVLVELSVVGPGGTFVPAEGAEIRLAPGSVVSSDITDSLTGAGAAVELRSTVPVTATVRSIRDGDVSYAASADVLSGPTAAVLIERARATVLLSSVGPEGVALVREYDASGRPVRQRSVAVPAGGTAAVKAARSAAYLTVTPQRGRLVGAVSYAGDAGISRATLENLALTIDRPAVIPGL